MTDVKTAPESIYIHGYSHEEQQRLSSLNELLNERCLRELNPDSGIKVIDVGCGLGQFSRAVARVVGDNGIVLGIDKDQQQFKQAIKLANDDGEQDLVEFRQGDAYSLPLKDHEMGTFDLVYTRFLLEHLPDCDSAIEQMVRATKPGGRVFLADDDHGDFRPWPMPDGFDAIWKAYVSSYERAGNDPYVGRKLVSLLHRAGLHSIRNSCVFFGGSAGDETFGAVADNLIGVLAGAKDSILSDGLLDEKSFFSSLDALARWRDSKESALWYSICCAEGKKGMSGEPSCFDHLAY